MSSALSAAKASADHIHDIWHGIPANQYVSMGVYSDGSYDVPKDIVFSFPVKLQNKQFKIVEVVYFTFLNHHDSHCDFYRYVFFLFTFYA